MTVTKRAGKNLAILEEAWPNKPVPKRPLSNNPVPKANT